MPLRKKVAPNNRYLKTGEVAQKAEITYREVGDVGGDDPQELGKEEDFVEQKVQEVGKAAKEAEDVEDYEPQGLSGSAEVRAEQVVDKYPGGATGYHESEDNVYQATDERAWVGSGLRAESGMLQDGADQSVKADKADRVESRLELIKPFEGLQNDADWKTEGGDGVGGVDTACDGSDAGTSTTGVHWRMFDRSDEGIGCKARPLDSTATFEKLFWNEKKICGLGLYVR